jgi:hypothetical protein
VHVAAYLRVRDLTGFNPKTARPRTPAFWDIVDANRTPEQSELADLLDTINSPECVTLERIIPASANASRNRRAIAQRMESAATSRCTTPMLRAITHRVEKPLATLTAMITRKGTLVRDHYTMEDGAVDEARRRERA